MSDTNTIDISNLKNQKYDLSTRGFRYETKDGVRYFVFRVRIGKVKFEQWVKVPDGVKEFEMTAVFD